MPGRPIKTGGTPATPPTTSWQQQAQQYLQQYGQQNVATRSTPFGPPTRGEINKGSSLGPGVIAGPSTPAGWTRQQGPAAPNNPLGLGGQTPTWARRQQDAPDLQTANTVIPAWAANTRQQPRGATFPGAPFGPQAPAGYVAPQNPNWLQRTLAPRPAGSGLPTRAKNYNATPPGDVPVGSFLSGGGVYALSADGTPVETNPSIFPSGSLLSGGGDVNTGSPYFPVLPALDDQSGAGGGFGTTYGSNWGRKRYGGGGYGGYGGYGSNYNDYQPTFSLGLNSWNFGE